jgi:hypothetical protein
MGDTIPRPRRVCYQNRRVTKVRRLSRSTRRRRDPSVERGHGAPSWQTGTCAGELSPRAARPAHRRPDVTTPEAGTDAGGHTLHRPRPMCAALRAQSSALARERRLARRHPRAPEVPPRDAGLDPRITDGPVSEAGARVRTAPREPHILRCCEARQRGEHGVLSSSRGRVVQSRRDRSWRSDRRAGPGPSGRVTRPLVRSPDDPSITWAALARRFQRLPRAPPASA